MEFDDHSWLPFLDQPKSDVVVFAIIYFEIYKNLVTKWEHGISTDNTIPSSQI